MDYTSTLNNLTKYIIQAIDQRIHKAKFNKTIKARITGKLKEGVYQVKYHNADYSVQSGFQHNAGDMVRICVPNNNFNDLFVICPVIESDRS